MNWPITKNATLKISLLISSLTLLINFSIVLAEEVPFDINKVPNVYHDRYFVSKPVGKDCVIGQEQQAISNYALINLPDGNTMGVCLAMKSQREQLEKTIQEATKVVKIETGRVGGTVSKYVVTYPIPCKPIAGGQCPTVDTPAGYVARLYQFGLMIVGLIAFASIVFGALRYILSAGNLASIDEAKDQIKQAVLGVVLLLGAYLILYTINPTLVSLRNPSLEPINLQQLREDARPPEDLQRLPPGGRGGADPLCKAAVNLNVTINASQAGGSKCVTCTTGATADSSGVCQCDSGRIRYQDACLTPTEVEGLPDTSIADEVTCNNTTNRIWRNGQCVIELLGF